MGQYASAIINDTGAYDFSQSPVNDHTTNFLAEHLPYAEAIARQRGIHPFSVLGQMAMESNWGRSNGATNGTYNYGNIDEIRPEMPAVWEQDRYANGQKYRAKRRVFSNLADMYRYKNALYDQNLKGVNGAYSPEDYAKAMVASGYAQDPQYGQKTMDLYNSVARRMPNYNWTQTQPSMGHNTLDALAGDVNSGNWGVEGATAQYAKLSPTGQQNFGVHDPRPMRRR